MKLSRWQSQGDVVAAIRRSDSFTKLLTLWSIASLPSSAVSNSDPVLFNDNSSTCRRASYRGCAGGESTPGQDCPGSPAGDRKANKNALISGAGFIPRRSGYLGKIAWSNAALSPTLNLSFVLMCRPWLSTPKGDDLGKRSSTLSLASLGFDSCTPSPCDRL
jgi:hypothetical protein